MALDTLAALDKHKARPFPQGYDANVRTFCSPVDDVSGALADTISLQPPAWSSPCMARTTRS